MGWNPITRQISITPKSFRMSQAGFNWGFAHEFGHAVEATVLASAEDFMARANGHIAEVPLPNGTSREIYEPGDIRRADRENGWSTNNKRGPSEDWADTFAYFATCAGQSHSCVAEPFTTSTSGNTITQGYGPGLSYSSTQPSSSRYDYYSIVLQRARAYADTSNDQQQCPNYCWYDVMIGQNEEEAFATVSQIPVIDKRFIWHDGDEEVYIHVEHSRVEPGVTFIEWHEKGSYGWWDNNTAILQDNVVDTLLIQLPESIPLQVVLNRFGEPSFIRPVDIIDSNFFVKLVYPESGVTFYVAVESRQNSNEMYLTGITSVVAVALQTPEITMEEYCVKDYYMRWAGFGNVTKYTFPQAEELIINEVPDWCEQ